MVCVCVGGLSLIFPRTLQLGRGRALKAQCGLFLHLSGNATITDHRPSKTRVVLGLEGDKQPAIPSQCIDPSHNLHYWEKKYCQLPTNKHLPIPREGIGFGFFFQLQKGEKKCFSELQKEPTKKQVETIRPLSSFLCLTYFSVFHPPSLFGHWVLPCHSSDSSPHNSNGAEILFVIRYGNSTVISQMMPRHAG